MLKKQLYLLGFLFLFLCLDQPVMGDPKKQPLPALSDDSKPITTTTRQRPNPALHIQLKKENAPQQKHRRSKKNLFRKDKL
ncbi:MAG: hypothetical protein ACD_16C00200G0002 [uncultured bacterium]|nr:MAG: hypothetical protein ACD_16C00200G0002 [uncultured bacterium]HAZ15497.1 hypothetical protein [Parachlamydiales bacterium]